MGWCIVKHRDGGIAMAVLVGVDGGNNTIKTAVDAGKTIIIPTIAAPYRSYDQGLELLEVNRRALKDSMDVEIILNYDNDSNRKELGRFYVGNYAKEMEGVSIKERTMGKAKAGDDLLLICMMSSVAVTIVDEEACDLKHVQQQVRMVTGLPFLQYRTGRDEFVKTLLGKHKIIFRGAYEVEVELDVTDVHTEIEGLGALNKTILNNSNKSMFKEEEIIDRTILGIDIGEFTSDVLALVFKDDGNGGIVPEFRQKLCMGIDMGISSAKQPIIDLIREKYNTIVDRSDIDTCLRRKHRKGEIDLETGDTFNIMGLFEENLEHLSNILSVLINNKVKSMCEKGRIKYALLYGGGVCALDGRMGELLKEKIGEVIGGQCIILEDAQIINVLGYVEKAKKLYV